MPETPTAPTAPSPSAAAAPAPQPVDHQIAALADAVRELSRSHQTLLDVVSRVAPPQSTSSTSAAEPARYVGREIVGDPGDGLRPAAAVDYARLSPLQQIALGLRHATPVGPGTTRRRAGAGDVVPMSADDDDATRARAGAD